MLAIIAVIMNKFHTKYVFTPIASMISSNNANGYNNISPYIIGNAYPKLSTAL